MFPSMVMQQAMAESITGIRNGGRRDELSAIHQFPRNRISTSCQIEQRWSLHYICMDWRHQLEVLVAGAETFSSLKNLCVWSKSNAGMGSFYRSQHELVFVFKAGSGKHRNNIELGRHGRHRSNVWQYPNVTAFGRRGEEGDLFAMHPTVKPVAMVADAVARVGF